MSTSNRPLPDSIGVKKLSKSVRLVLTNTPERLWNRIRAYFPGSEEEITLCNLIPHVRQAIETCPPRFIHRMRKKEITPADVDEAYNRLHDAIGSVDQAVGDLFRLADMKRWRSGPTRTHAKPAKPPGPSKDPAEDTRASA